MAGALAWGAGISLPAPPAAWLPRQPAAASPPYRIAFANANETPGARLEGLGFTGADVRRSFELAARTLPVDMIYYDNAGDAETAVSNAVDAIGRKVDLLIEYNPETSANAEIARRMAEAPASRCWRMNYPIGDAPLYTADNFARRPHRRPRARRLRQGELAG